jgi:hypothetical protein
VSLSLQAAVSHVDNSFRERAKRPPKCERAGTISSGEREPCTNSVCLCVRPVCGAEPTVLVAEEPKDDTGLPSWTGRFVDRAGWERDRLSRQNLGT